MNAHQFLTAFQQAVMAVQPSGYGKEWTDSMYQVLTQVGQDVGYVVNHKHSYREINLLDFAYFLPAPDDTVNWHPPTVIIEHENAYNEEETRRDFWKACLYTAPLRVTIGYQADREQAYNVGKALTAFYHQYNLRQIADGETLLIMGWNQIEQDRQWLAWRLQGEQSQWSELTI
jgi:hypothetical protein